MVAQGGDLRRRRRLVADRLHRDPFAEDPSVRVEDQRLPGIHLLAGGEQNGDVAARVIAERLGGLDHTIDADHDGAIGLRHALQRRGLDFLDASLEDELGLVGQLTCAWFRRHGMSSMAERDRQNTGSREQTARQREAGDTQGPDATSGAIF